MYINNVKYQIDGGSYHCFLHIPTNGWLLEPSFQPFLAHHPRLVRAKDRSRAYQGRHGWQSNKYRDDQALWYYVVLFSAETADFKMCFFTKSTGKKISDMVNICQKIWCSTCDDGRMTELGCLLPQIHPTKVPRPKTCDTWSIGARVEVQEPQLWDFGPGICQRFVRAKSWSSWWILNFFSYRIRHFFHATLILETTISGKILRWERTGQRIEKKIQNDLRPTEHSCIQPTIGCRSLAQKKTIDSKTATWDPVTGDKSELPQPLVSPRIQKLILRVHNALQGLQGWTEHVFLPANILFLFRKILCLMIVTCCYHSKANKMSPFIIDPTSQLSCAWETELIPHSSCLQHNFPTTG